MNGYTVSVQHGLSEISNMLEREGYNVCYMGQCEMNADVTVIDVPDSEYQGIRSAECRMEGSDNSIFVINSANYSPKEIVELIKNNKCC